ncbi:hypothetical protein F5884DRAFT_715402, partial [Xylogone sp. PMI_703]
MAKPVATHTVDVGASGSFIYKPNHINASVGDIVRFNFLGQSHSVTEADFNTPCTYNGGFDTGLRPFGSSSNVTGNFFVDLHVNSSAPRWFYSKQSNGLDRCGESVIFAINPGNCFRRFE